MEYSDVSSQIGASAEKQVGRRLFLRRSEDLSISLETDIWAKVAAMPTKLQIKVITWDNSGAILGDLNDWLCQSTLNAANRFINEFGQFSLHNNYWYFHAESGKRTLYSRGMLLNEPRFMPEVEKSILNHDSMWERQIWIYVAMIQGRSDWIRRNTYAENMLSRSSIYEDLSHAYYEVIQNLISPKDVKKVRDLEFERSVCTAFQCFGLKYPGLVHDSPQIWRNVFRSMLFLGPHRSKHLLAKIKTVRMLGEPF